MSTTAPVISTKLSPDLFPVILSHLPLSSRISTSLSVALTCHLLHDVIIPHVLYRDVRIGVDHRSIDEDRVLRLLEGLVGTAEASKDESQGRNYTTTPNQCIRHLSIELMEAMEPVTRRLQRLFDLDGLTNLLSLTLRFVIPSTLPPALWRSVKDSCPNLKGIHLTNVKHGEWIQSGVFAIKESTSIRLHAIVEAPCGSISQKFNIEADGNYRVVPVPGSPTPRVKLDFSNISSQLHTLDLRISNVSWGQADAACAGGLLSCDLPQLRTLILDCFDVSIPDMATMFWKAHSDLERLELGGKMWGDWFQDFESGMLPNLKVFKSNFRSAKSLLPFVAKSLVSLYLVETYHSQAVYLLRTIPEGGTLPGLRSLGIQQQSGAMINVPLEGMGWREDTNGRVTEVMARRITFGGDPIIFGADEIMKRMLDGNYLMSIAKAAPNLEQLELMGDSDDTIDSITASLCLMPKLNRLTLSAPQATQHREGFFPWSSTWAEYTYAALEAPKSNTFQKYRPLSFDEAVRDLANGCRTLETVTFSDMVPSASMMDGHSVRIFRESEGGLMKEARRIRAWGNIMGLEED